MKKMHFNGVMTAVMLVLASMRVSSGIVSAEERVEVVQENDGTEAEQSIKGYENDAEQDDTYVPYQDETEADELYEDEYVLGGSSTSNGVTINETNINLYYSPGENAVAAAKNIPSNYPQSFQLSVNGGSNISYSVISGYSAQVSATGLVTPVKKTWYRYDMGNYIISTTSPDYPDGEYIGSYDKYEAGETKIRVTAGNAIFTVTVNVKNYGSVYANNELEAYIANNITGKNLSDKELLNQICKFPAGYNYSTDASGWTGMVVYGGGDCWASTSAILAICERLGIEAWSRNGNKDPGAGSGHMNAMVKLNGKYYELEAGYYQTAPRSYTVSERKDLFNYYEYGVSAKDGCTVYQYDGKDEPGSTLTIPEKSGSYFVRKIGDLRGQCEENYVKINLPASVISIEEFALTAYKNLETLEIPANVSSIGQGAFANTNLNKNFRCSKDNPYYMVENGVLYSKDKTILLAAPAVADLVMPETVTTIGAYAFYYNNNIASITVPASVTAVEEAAFGDCNNLKSLDLSKTKIKTIPDFTFADSHMDYLILPSTLESVSENAFYGASMPDYIYGTKGSYAEQYANEKGITFREGRPEDYKEKMFAKYQGYSFFEDEWGNKYCLDSNGNKVINEFKCDGTYTYYFQADGTAMRDRLTYHPDGVHVIYFDEYGHEVFSNFHEVKKSIAGEAVDDLCFFDVYGYMYVDVMTYGNAAFGNGDKVYYVNPYGVIERNGWFGFSDTCVWAGTDKKVGMGIGYANSDGSLMINQHTYYNGNLVYMQGDGHIQ